MEKLLYIELFSLVLQMSARESFEFKKHIAELIDPTCLLIYTGAGTSGNECSDIYRGKSPFSEIEVKQVANALAKISHSNGLKAYWNIHAYSQLVLYPWSYTSDVAKDNYEIVSISLHLYISSRYHFFYYKITKDDCRYNSSIFPEFDRQPGLSSSIIFILHFTVFQFPSVFFYMFLLYFSCLYLLFLHSLHSSGNNTLH